MTQVVDMRDAFFDGLYKYIAKDKNVIILTADHGAFGLKKIESDYPEQYLNVGIAEQTLISVAAGLAMCGKKVYVYAINNFVSLRVLEQINIDLCAMNLDVNIIGVGAGFTYSTDGPTHQGVQDLAAMINLPNLQVYNVTDDLNTQKLVDLSYTLPGPKYFRLEKGKLPRIYEEKDDIMLGFKEISTRSSKIGVISTGFMTQVAKEVLENLEENSAINVSHLDIYSMSPIPTPKIIEFSSKKHIITLEENIKSGGFGEKINSILKHAGHSKNILNLVTDNYYMKKPD